MIKSRDELSVFLPKDAVVCEVGVAEGNNSWFMVNTWPIKLLYCVDAWQTLDQRGDGSLPQVWHDQNFDKFFDRMMPMVDSGKVKVLRGLSVEMAKQVPDESLDLLYLDGDHNYEGVKADLAAWFPKVKPGGVISGHDYMNVSDYGVNRAVNEFCEANHYQPIVIPENNEMDASFYFKK